MKTFKGGFHVPDNKELTATAAIEQMPVVPDEYTMGELLIHFNHDCDLIIAVGTGSINVTC